MPIDLFGHRSARHSQVSAGLPQIDPKLQRLLAELVMLRLVDEFQEAISGIAARLACGAVYADGSAATLLTAPAGSVSGAITLFENHVRSNRKFAKWSRVDFIAETTKNVLSPANAFIGACTANSLTISEMQAVRNRIAHGGQNARMAFRTVVVRRYGAALNHVSPGLLLLSPRFAPCLLDQYIAACRLIVRNCSKS